MTTFPRTIITTAYHIALAVGGVVMPGPDILYMSMLMPPMTPMTPMTSMSIAHHYRLVYLRSEIFRSLYLPAVPAADGHNPDSNNAEDNILGAGLGLAWLRGRHLIPPTLSSSPFPFTRPSAPPEHSALGCYPMTFISAHNIYMASSTLLAHALLRLDGHVRVLSPMGDPEPAPRRMSTDSPLQQGTAAGAPGTHPAAELDWVPFSTSPVAA